MRLWVWAGLASMIGTACGGGGTSGDGGGGDGGGGGGGNPAAELAAFDAWYQQRAEVLCARAFECQGSFPQGATEFTARYGPDQETCEADQTATNEYLEVDRTALSTGRQVFVDASGGECATTYTAYTCAEYWENAVEACKTSVVLEGAVPIGEACLDYDDCADEGVSCDEAPGQDGGELKTCQRPAA